MDMCRVVQKLGGALTIIRPSPNSRREGEDEATWLDRIFTNHMRVREMIGLPFVDMPVSELPQDRSQRNKWRLNEGKVFVDLSIIDIKPNGIRDGLRAKPDNTTVTVKDLRDLRII